MRYTVCLNAVVWNNKWHYTLPGFVRDQSDNRLGSGLFLVTLFRNCAILFALLAVGIHLIVGMPQNFILPLSKLQLRFSSVIDSLWNKSTGLLLTTFACFNAVSYHARSASCTSKRRNWKYFLCYIYFSNHTFSIAWQWFRDYDAVFQVVCWRWISSSNCIFISSVPLAGCRNFMPYLHVFNMLCNAVTHQ